ncbi:MAG: hypothetical protein MJ219_04460 [Mycoplasmoidaceae bacterium]|nr:hypothetical protein [Mycoplasmoidaceae bacterium]
MYLYYDKIPLIPDMTINVVVEQDAVSIIADDNYPFYTTTETNLNISPMPGSKIDTGQIGIYPNTATKADGSN